MIIHPLLLLFIIMQWDGGVRLHEGRPQAYASYQKGDSTFTAAVDPDGRAEFEYNLDF